MFTTEACTNNLELSNKFSSIHSQQFFKKNCSPPFQICDFNIPLSASFSAWDFLYARGGDAVVIKNSIDMQNNLLELMFTWIEGIALELQVSDLMAVPLKSYPDWRIFAESVLLAGSNVITAISVSSCLNSLHFCIAYVSQQWACCLLISNFLYNSFMFSGLWNVLQFKSLLTPVIQWFLIVLLLRSPSVAVSEFL